MKRFMKHSVLLAAALAVCAFLFAGTAASAEQETWEECYKKGIEYAEARKYGPAIEWLTKAIGLNPENPELYLQRGLCHALNTGDEPGVIRIAPEENRSLSKADFQKALSLDPGNKELEERVGEAQAKADKFLSAFEDSAQPLTTGDDTGKAQASFDDLSAYEEPAEYDHRYEWFYDDGRLRGFILYDSLNRKIYEEQYPYYPADFQGGRKITDRIYFFWDSDSFPCAGMAITYSDELVEGEMVKQQNYSVTEYNERGMMTRSASYLADGTLVHERIYPIAGQGSGS